MKTPGYEYRSEGQLLLYEFTSEGPRGKVKKIVEYAETSVKGVYNLAFGDYDESTGEINDSIITNNGDGQKVLATVASTVYAFTGEYPDAWIYAKGNSPGRTRLYRIGIATNLVAILVDFEVYGLRDEVWEEFVIGMHYRAFLVRRKNRNFGR